MRRGAARRLTVSRVSPHLSSVVLRAKNTRRHDIMRDRIDPKWETRHRVVVTEI